METMLIKNEERAPVIKRERNYGIDVLRIVSMFMVVLLHVFGVGGVINNTVTFSGNYCAAWTFEIAAMCAVNCCALVSGYVGYGSKHKHSGIIELSLRAVFYTIVITGVYVLIYPQTELSFILKSLYSICTTQYWYFVAYFCAYFFFPYLDIVVEKLPRKEGKILITTLLVMFSLIPFIIGGDVFYVASGYSPLWLMIMYTVGAYAKKYDIGRKIRPSWYLLGYIATAALTTVIYILIVMLEKNVGIHIFSPSRFISYPSPFIVAEGWFLLMFFAHVNVREPLIKITAFLAPLSFGVYLVHTQYIMWMYLTGRFIKYSEMNTAMMLLAVLSTTAAIYLVCSFADYIRTLIFRLLKVKELSAKIGNLTDKRN